ncbi:hypothetical protein OJ253_1443 [Cryptosporidium canis]|uniref:Uncharacterized protein n=1 Tax=Cryptosporidium canis TaxID=195482 RepID=A0A9D5DHR7_9CRYT|nr:hypothetical protein OJ253_1443 [Cryptosporidium canis]
MSRKDREFDEQELERLLEHLTLQNDAFSSSNKLLMGYYRALKIQNCNVMSLIKAMICITTPNSLQSEEDGCASILNTCKLKWVESLYDFLNITDHDSETIVISPILESHLVSDAKFELRMSIIKSEKGLSKDLVLKTFYSNIIGSLSLIHDYKGIRDFTLEALGLFEAQASERQSSCETLFNIFLVKLFNDQNSEEAILISDNQNEESSQIFRQGLNFVDPCKYFCFDRCILFNKFNLRFLIYNNSGGLCWSDRICDMSTQFLQDYQFLFKSDNPKRKLIFNIISSFNQFISKFMISSIDALKIDQTGSNPIYKANQNQSSEPPSAYSPLNENKLSEPLSPIETFNAINDVLSLNKSFLNNSMIRPGNENSSIISSINTFTSCVSQEIHLDKIDISSNQVTNLSDSNLQAIRRSDSNTTTLSEFIGVDTTHLPIPSATPGSINIDFFYENDIHTHEWILL